MGFEFDSVEEVLEDLRQGKLVIVTDDENRENEGDLVCAAEKVTPDIINFMITNARGLVCAPITEARARELGILRPPSTRCLTYPPGAYVQPSADAGMSTSTAGPSALVSSRNASPHRAAM